MLITRLSYKKIQIEVLVPIWCGGSKIDDFILKRKYKYIDENNYPIMIQDSTIQNISRKYGIKMKSISIRSKDINISFENNVIVLKCPDFINFESEFWFMRYKKNRRDKILYDLIGN